MVIVNNVNTAAKHTRVLVGVEIFVCYFTSFILSHPTSCPDGLWETIQAMGKMTGILRVLQACISAAPFVGCACTGAKQSCHPILSAFIYSMNGPRGARHGIASRVIKEACQLQAKKVDYQRCHRIVSLKQKELELHRSPRLISAITGIAEEMNAELDMICVRIHLFSTFV